MDNKRAILIERIPGWEWVALGLSAPVVFVAGCGFHRLALAGLGRRAATMDTLISVGTLAAFGWSTVVLAAGLGTAPTSRSPG